MFALLFDDLADEADEADRRRRLVPVFRQRQYFELENFHARFRLTREQTEWLMSRIGSQVEAQTQRTNALSVQDKMLMSLRYFASGSIYSVIADANGPSPTSVQRAIKSVTKAINAALFQEQICFPRNMDALRLAYYQVNAPNGMPMACGCVDGTLINIIAPSEDEGRSVHDARVFRNSTVAQRFENGWRPFDDAVLLGDSGYKLHDYLLTPIANPVSPAERRYNASHRKTRRVIECAYGVLKNSFLCLKRLRHKDPVFCCEVIKACAVLHNLRTPENYVANIEETLNNLGVEMEADEDDDSSLAGNVGDDSDDDAAPTQAAQRDAAQRRLHMMVNTFHR